MSMTFNNKKLTICEVLRQINDRVQGDAFSDVRDMIALAEQMAKKIVSKLREYNEKDNPELWFDKETRDSFDRDMETYLIGNPERAERLLSKEINENSSSTN